eukprot:1915157-Pyramimonas_sp.AAC.1
MGGRSLLCHSVASWCTPRHPRLADVSLAEVGSRCAPALRRIMSVISRVQTHPSAVVLRLIPVVSDFRHALSAAGCVL